MAELILHHFLTSPFSEKVRLILGYKRLAWKSVLVPGYSPKPDVVALTGGYRRTPLLQIGADIYCDTALIGTGMHSTPAFRSLSSCCYSACRDSVSTTNTCGAAQKRKSSCCCSSGERLRKGGKDFPAA